MFELILLHFEGLVLRLSNLLPCSAYSAQVDELVNQDCANVGWRFDHIVFDSMSPHSPFNWKHSIKRSHLEWTLCCTC